eukprot:TRINITY_DN3280_c0_g1_i2.p1 TRINITY_DN3280_c0_g1~~TRINITY_DN3280_c0_g1_i2.p1  ORF type:complete len:517 (-),score=248.88 TRINITY_DN3280_c0_g1_i2:189-1739(-)
MTVFSVSAFFIVLREVLEACLVVGIVLAYLQKIGATHLNKWVWLGTAAGIALSLGVGIAFAVVFHVKGNQIFEGATEKIFEGFVFLLASGLLTWMLIWMMHMGKSLRTNMENAVGRAVEAGGWWRIFALVFVQVLREGIETVIFVGGSAGADGQGGWKAIPFPSILAIVAGVTASFLMFRGMITLDIQKFFLLSSFLLIGFAAGLVSHALHEFQEVDWFGQWNDIGPEKRDWWNAAVWSTVECCNDKTNQFWAMCRALFGYQDKPTFLEMISYIAYWVVILCIFGYIQRDVILRKRSATATLVRWTSSALAVAGLVGFIYAIGNTSWNGILLTTLTLLVGTTAAVAAFDSAGGLVAGLKPLRRPMMLVSAIGFAVIAVLDVCITLAQLICEGRSCTVPKFLHWGLILTEEWATRGNLGLSKDLTYGDGRGYVYVAVLTLSLALTIFLCGVHAFGSYRFAVNLDAAGDYIYDDAAEVDAEGAKLAPLAGEEDATGSSDGAADAPYVQSAPMGPVATA